MAILSGEHPKWGDAAFKISELMVDDDPGRAIALARKAYAAKRAIDAEGEQALFIRDWLLKRGVDPQEPG